MNQTFDVVALGELLIDFTQNGVSEQGNPLLEANPGGAPCNVLAMLQKLGKSTAFVGKVGEDMFGRHLTNLVMDPAAHTTLAFVQTFANGDRDFSFYRDPGADLLLTADEVPEDVIANSRIFHFGTLSMTHPGVREATKRAGCDLLRPQPAPAPVGQPGGCPGADRLGPGAMRRAEDCRQ